MKAIAILLISLICINDIAAVSLRRSKDNSNDSTINKLRKFGEESDVAGRMISAIELSLASGSKIDEWIDVIKGYLIQAKEVKTNTVKEKGTVLGNLQDEIDELTKDVAEDTMTLKNVIENIVAYTIQKSMYENKIEALKTEIQDLQIRKEAIDAARVNDQNSFARRQVRDENALKALGQIIPALEELKNKGSNFLQKSDADLKEALAKIPKGHPIEALVQVSAKFNPTKLQFVINKLNDIKESIEASKADDEAKEKESGQKFIELIDEVLDVKVKKTVQMMMTANLLRAVNTKLDAAVQKRDNLKIDIAANTKLRDSQQEQHGILTKQYDASIQSAQDAVDALEVCQQILVDGKADTELVQIAEQ